MTNVHSENNERKKLHARLLQQLFIILVLYETTFKTQIF